MSAPVSASTAFWWRMVSRSRSSRIGMRFVSCSIMYSRVLSSGHIIFHIGCSQKAAPLLRPRATASSMVQPSILQDAILLGVCWVQSELAGRTRPVSPWNTMYDSRRIVQVEVGSTEQLAEERLHL